jgi:thiol:disulfide interchange protein
MTRKTFITSIVITILSLLTLSGFSQESTGIKFFHGTFDEAIAKAKKENKVIFVDAYAVWCGPCKIMAARTFTNAEVGNFHNSKFINLKIDMEKGEGRTLSRKWGITAYPTLLYFDGDGNMVHKTMGYHQPDQLLQVGNQVLAKQKKK